MFAIDAKTNFTKKLIEQVWVQDRHDFTDLPQLNQAHLMAGRLVRIVLTCAKTALLSF